MTDRSTEYKGPCLCGKGTVQIDHCTPDHAWSTTQQLWYEDYLNCDVCAANYQIVRQGYDFVFVKRHDIANQTAQKDEAWAAYEAANHCPSADSARAELAAMLDSAGSVAAAYRLVSSLSRGALPTFRRHWRGGKTFATDVSAINMPTVFKIVGHDASEFDSLYANYNNLKAKAEKPVPAVSLIHTVSQLPSSD